MDTTTTDNMSIPVSNGGKFKLRGLSASQPTMTVTGATNKAICADDPIATTQKVFKFEIFLRFVKLEFQYRSVCLHLPPMAKFILSFIATFTAVKCSTTLPIMGNITIPTNVLEIPLSEQKPSMLSTK